MRVVALILASAALAGGATDPKSMVLQKRDVPVDFRLAKARYVSNAQAAKETEVKKNFTRLGRQQGYEATYEKKGKRGILVVVSRASTYRTPAGARESMELDVKGAEHSRRVRFRRVALATPIGDDARMYRATVKQGATTVELYTISWRSGRVYSAVIGSGVAGTGKPWFVIKLARRQQARIGRVRS